jgi:Spy/CpxP family protein refolding chaperone
VKKSLLFVLAMFLTAGLAVTADAAMHGKGKGKGKSMGKGPDRGMMGHCMEDGKPMMMMKLGLDDKQEESAMTTHMKMKKETIRKKADVEVAEIELKEILTKDPVDLKAAEAKLKQIEAIKTDLHFSHIKAHEEIKAILTPEQRKKFNSMIMGMGHMCMMGGRMGCGMGMMHGGGMGMMHGDGMGKGMMGRCGMMGGMDQDDRKEPEKKDAAPASGHQH